MDRVTDPADPSRCQQSNREAQCTYRAEPGDSYCARHLGKNREEPQNREMYMLTNARLRSRKSAFHEHDEIKSLREEIALSRAMIEERLRLVTNDAEMLAAMNPVHQYLLTVERLVKSAHLLEQNLGTLLAKPTLLKIGQEICQIVVEELRGVEGYEEIVDRITDRIIGTIATANNAEKVSDE